MWWMPPQQLNCLLRLVMQCCTMHVAAWRSYNEGTQYGACKDSTLCTVHLHNRGKEPAQTMQTSWLQMLRMFHNSSQEQLKRKCIGCGQGWPGAIGKLVTTVHLPGQWLSLKHVHNAASQG
jgi:hypothetical protein